MEWMLGIITGLLMAILMLLTGNRWVCGWIFAAGMAYVVWVVVHSMWQESRARRSAKDTKPVDFRSFMGME